MRGHVSAGADILMSTATLQTAAPVVLASHEWYSGSGYPQRLAGACRKRSVDLGADPAPPVGRHGPPGRAS